MEGAMADFAISRIGETRLAVPRERTIVALLLMQEFDKTARSMGVGGTVDAREKLFASTSWTLIGEAGGAESSDQTCRAVTQLCTIYWRPLYLFLRRQGYNSHDAQDLTQEFFAQLIATRFYTRAERDQGRFRSYLLGALKHYLSNRREYESAQKRGRGVEFVPLTDAVEQEVNETIARSYRLDAEASYEREWAVTLLRRVITLLEQECRIAGKAQLFESLKGRLGAEETNAASYEELAQQLSRSVTNLRKDVSRLRQRYRTILRGEVGQTVVNDDEIDAELRHLRAVMAG